MRGGGSMRALTQGSEFMMSQASESEIVGMHRLRSASRGLMVSHGIYFSFECNDIVIIGRLGHVVCPRSE